MASEPKSSVAPELAVRSSIEHTDREEEENEDAFESCVGDDLASAGSAAAATPDTSALNPSQQKLVKTMRDALESASAANPECFAREVRFMDVCRMVSDFAGFPKRELANLLKLEFGFRSPAETIRHFCSDLVTLVGGNKPSAPPVEASLLDTKIAEFFHTSLCTKQSKPIDVIKWLAKETGISQRQMAKEYAGGDSKALKTLVAEKMKQHGGLVKRSAEQKIVSMLTASSKKPRLG
eukprot:TRINITY_DN1187_c0_g1_i1.p1 TRINITY_DN1187_c0_g1~~TRINITY_DN1187_c0_g1_i1.p1  ORF type:complete len:237 (-),score=47.05 TRINITY_DN1187_c0_g1_i1:91-801(-)